jgi:hypothetical protein
LKNHGLQKNACASKRPVIVEEMEKDPEQTEWASRIVSRGMGYMRLDLALHHVNVKMSILEVVGN